uniref:Small ribosomal subunit protein uS15m n=1 Tax=Panagrellus redivivus TaxID=6233 RepID=A0A7E4W1G1_PANRE
MLPSLSKVPALAVTGSRALHVSASTHRGRYNFYNKHKKVTDPRRADPDYFEKQAAKLPLDKNYLDALVLLWSEKVGSERELMMKASDKLIQHDGNYGLPELDKSKPRLAYEKVDALTDAPEAVKKVFSIDYGERRDLTDAWKRELVESVNKHQFDHNSLQAKIAWATALIRHWTMLVDHLQSKNPKKPVWLTHRIFLMLGYRRKQLRLLREQDTAEFERVLDVLQIAYSVPKPPEHIKTRKAWSEHQLRQRVEAEKERRLEELHEKLKIGRDEEVAKLDKHVSDLKSELSRIDDRLNAIAIAEGTQVAGVKGEYQVKLVEELSETVIHSILWPRDTKRATA